MKYLAIACAWLAYAGVVAAIAFGTKDSGAALLAAFVGGVFVLAATLGISCSKSN